VEFITENAVFVGLALASGLMLLWPILTGGRSDYATNVTPNEAVLLMNRAKTLILDVREEDEFKEGHIQGAKHVPLGELQNRLSEFSKQKSKPILVHCQRGMRSKSACKILAANEFTQLHQLEGGIDKWVEAKMPVVKV